MNPYLYSGVIATVMLAAFILPIAVGGLRRSTNRQDRLFVAALCCVVAGTAAIAWAFAIEIVQGLGYMPASQTNDLIGTAVWLALTGAGFVLMALSEYVGRRDRPTEASA